MSALTKVTIARLRCVWMTVCVREGAYWTVLTYIYQTRTGKDALVSLNTHSSMSRRTFYEMFGNQSHKKRIANIGSNDVG